jgi:nucleoside-diphosphate-sugar epimerase
MDTPIQTSASCPPNASALASMPPSQRTAGDGEVITSPFGEHPTGESENVETDIEPAGIKFREETWLLTGGSGFIGCRVAAQLDELVDATICPGTLIVLIRKTSNIASLLECTPRLQAVKKLKLIESDLADLQTLSRVVPSYVSVVIHSAAEGGDWGPRQVFVNSNEVGTANLVDVVTKKCTHLRRFVHVSSVDVYPHNVKPSLCFEDVPIVDHSNYGYTHTKAAAERIVMQQLNSCEWTILRPAVVYGPGSTIAANIGYLSRLLFVNRFIFLGLRRSKNIIKRIWFIDRGILLRQRRSVC